MLGGGGDTTQGPGDAPSGTDDCSVGPGLRFGVPKAGLKKLASRRDLGVFAGLKDEESGTRGEGMSRGDGMPRGTWDLLLAAFGFTAATLGFAVGMVLRAERQPDWTVPPVCACFLHSLPVLPCRALAAVVPRFVSAFETN